MGGRDGVKRTYPATEATWAAAKATIVKDFMLKSKSGKQDIDQRMIVCENVML